MDDEALFSTQWVKVELPPEEFPGFKGERIVCSQCGEGISYRREVTQAGKFFAARVPVKLISSLWISFPGYQNRAVTLALEALRQMVELFLAPGRISHRKAYLRGVIPSSSGVDFDS